MGRAPSSPSGGAGPRPASRGRALGAARPPLRRELENPRGFQPCVDARALQAGGPPRGITLSENLPALLDPLGGGPDASLFQTHRFTFDRVFPEDSSQELVYEQARVRGRERAIPSGRPRSLRSSPSLLVALPGSPFPT